MNKFLKKTGIFLQARINSSRMPGKALLKIMDKTIVEHAMDRLNVIPADIRVLLTTKDSEAYFASIAYKMGWNLFIGDKQNVLKRYIDAAVYYNVDTIIRATADNPLVSSEIAIATIDLFNKENCDLTYLSPIPYGSGVEVVKADALIKALENTNVPYDMEHVTPYIYKHKEKFIIKTANFHDKDVARPDVKISVDTEDDFSKINYLFRNLKKKTNNYKIKNIIETWDKLDFKKYKKCLFITAFGDNFGIGHLKRILYIAKKIDKHFYLYITFKEKNQNIVNTLKENNINYIEYENLYSYINSEGIFDRVIVDLRDTNKEEINDYKLFGPVISFDDLGEGGQLADINIQSIPSIKGKTERLYNFDNLEYLFTQITENVTKINVNKIPKKILISFGGVDPASLTKPTSRILEKSGYEITVIIGPYFKESLNESDKCRIVSNIDDLKDYIKESDIVITSFGMTFFESLKLKKPVIIINPSLYHDQLTKNINYPYLIENNSESSVIFSIDVKIEETIKKMIEDKVFEKEINDNPLKYFFKLNIGSKVNDLIDLIVNWKYTKPICPHCSKLNETSIYRNQYFNMYKCKNCGLIYIVNIQENELNYEKSYFNEEYKEQYGRTYEDDKDNIIKFAQDRLFMIRTYLEKGNLLDYGSGLGFFAEYCENNGFLTTCVDISKYAVNYITNVLKLKAIQGGFDYLENSNDIFDVITSFFVVEHIKDFEKLLFLFYTHLKKNGILALSTPNATGITIRKNIKEYAKTHPTDHYIILSSGLLKKILNKQGFTNIKIMIRGIHLERFIKSKFLLKNKLFNKILIFIVRILKLGDTFEIYAQKS